MPSGKHPVRLEWPMCKVCAVVDMSAVKTHGKV